MIVDAKPRYITIVMLKLLLFNYSGSCLASSCALSVHLQRIFSCFDLIGPPETEDKLVKVQGSDSSAKGRPGGKSCDQILKN